MNRLYLQSTAEANAYEDIYCRCKSEVPLIAWGYRPVGRNHLLLKMMPTWLSPWLHTQNGTRHISTPEEPQQQDKDTSNYNGCTKRSHKLHWIRIEIRRPDELHPRHNDYIIRSLRASESQKINVNSYALVGHCRIDLPPISSLSW